MFTGLIRNWREARGSGLKREFEDCIDRLNSMSDEASFLAQQWIKKAIDATTPVYGPINEIPPQKRKLLAKMFRKKAKQSFATDLSKSYGLGILSIYMESGTLPGDDAAYVYELSGQMVEAALIISENPEIDILTDKQDAVAQEAIKAGRFLGATTAREAAEMLAQRPISDEEWNTHKDAWERNWPSN